MKASRILTSVSRIELYDDVLAKVITGARAFRRREAGTPRTTDFPPIIFWQLSTRTRQGFAQHRVFAQTLGISNYVSQNNWLKCFISRIGDMPGFLWFMMDTLLTSRELTVKCNKGRIKTI